MGLIDSKNLVILIVGVLFSLLFTFLPFFNKIDFKNIYTIYVIIIIFGIVVICIIWAMGTRTGELYKVIEVQQEEQKRLKEKLKIHEQLIDIKADLQNIKREVYKK